MGLDGTSWTVTHIGGAPVLEGSPPTMAFDEGRIAGTTGCNRYFASYEASEGRMSLGHTGLTMMMCPDPAMDQERRMLGALERVDGYRAADDELHLLSGAESVVRATAATD